MLSNASMLIHNFRTSGIPEILNKEIDAIKKLVFVIASEMK